MQCGVSGGFAASAAGAIPIYSIPGHLCGLCIQQPTIFSSIFLSRQPGAAIGKLARYV